MDTQFIFPIGDVESFNESLNEVAERTATNAISCQKNILVLVGDVIYQKNPTKYYHIDTFVSNSMNNFWVPHNHRTVLYPKQTESFILDGLNNNQIIFEGKFNHLTLRQCYNIELILSYSPISGIDFLETENIKIRSTSYNSTNIEYCSNTMIEGEMLDSHLIVHSSVDVNINSQTLNVNPFKRECFDFVNNNNLSRSVPSIVNTIDDNRLSSSLPLTLNIVGTFNF